MLEEADDVSIRSFRNTGIRPKWDAFWKLELEIDPDKVSSAEPSTLSSANTTVGEFKHVKMVTGSDWHGEYDKLGMNGRGTYEMVHGVVYEGFMVNGIFEGYGILKYPNGGSLEGLWHHGHLTTYLYNYADGFEYGDLLDMNDRRFLTETVRGLKSADSEQRTAHDRWENLPPGTYNVGYGFFNTKTKCVTDPENGKILNIPSVTEEKFIKEKCRCSDIGNVGCCPELYENWTRVGTENKENKGEEKEILKLINQEGLKLEDLTLLDFRKVTTESKLSLISKDDSISIHKLLELNSPRKTEDFSKLIRKIERGLERDFNIKKKKFHEKHSTAEMDTYTSDIMYDHEESHWEEWILLDEEVELEGHGAKFVFRHDIPLEEFNEGGPSNDQVLNYLSRERFLASQNINDDIEDNKESK